MDNHNNNNDEMEDKETKRGKKATDPAGKKRKKKEGFKKRTMMPASVIDPNHETKKRIRGMPSEVQANGELEDVR